MRLALLVAFALSAYFTSSNAAWAQDSAAVSVASEQAASSDVVCEVLMRDYLLGGFKIEQDNIDAAIHLVAVRGYSNAFWRVVLAEFDRTFDADEFARDRKDDFFAKLSPNAQEFMRFSVRRNMLSVLRKMLAEAGKERWVDERTRRGEMLQRSSSLYFDATRDSKLLDRVIARASEARPSEFALFALAVRASHDPRGKAFLQEILRRKPLVHGRLDAQCVAAVGLAELGEPEGVEWLINHLDTPDHVHMLIVSHTEMPLPDRSVSELCGRALTELFGWKAVLQSKEQCQQIWGVKKTNFTPAGPVRLR